MSTEDLKQHINTTHDFYDLLSVTPQSSESEIRRAYRKTALKYHPDKVGANQELLDKFHLLQIAYDVLSDPSVKELYDNARRAREEKKEREAQYEGRRKQFKDDLEARETGFLKRKRDEEDAEAKFQQELARLAADGRRRREERAEMLRKEAQEEVAAAEAEPVMPVKGSAELEDADRSIRIRFPRSAETEHLSTARVTELFERFGKIQDVVLRDKKVKVDGSKHRQLVRTGMIVFNSIVGAHAAVSDIPKLRSSDPDYAPFESVEWASGQEPAYVPKPVSRASPPVVSAPPNANGTAKAASKAPSFGSFKGAKAKAAANGNAAAPSMDEITMMRLKMAEKRRLEEKIRREEAAAEEAQA